MFGILETFLTKKKNQNVLNFFFKSLTTKDKNQLTITSAFNVTHRFHPRGRIPPLKNVQFYFIHLYGPAERSLKEAFFMIMYEPKAILFRVYSRRRRSIKSCCLTQYFYKKQKNLHSSNQIMRTVHLS